MGGVEKSSEEEVSQYEVGNGVFAFRVSHFQTFATFKTFNLIEIRIIGIVL